MENEEPFEISFENEPNNIMVLMLLTEQMVAIGVDNNDGEWLYITAYKHELQGLINKLQEFHDNMKQF